MDYFCVSVVAFWNIKFASILRMVSGRKFNVIGIRWVVKKIKFWALFLINY